MAKIRKIASVENGLMEVLKIITEEEIKQAIGKGSSYIRKCSNPDLPQQIEINQSRINKDTECIEGSILDESAIRKAIINCTHVVHLAASLGVENTEANKLKCLEINIKGTEGNS